MITLEAADLIEGDASTAAEVDYTINGVQEAASVVTIHALASGQLADAKATIYTTPADTTTIVKSIVLVNTGAGARTVNLYVNSDGTSRRVVPEDISLEANGGTLILGDTLQVFDSAGQLKTVASGATHALLDGSVASDTTASAVTKGDIIIGNATPEWDDLVVGTDNYHLVVATDLPAWEELDISHDPTPTAGGPIDMDGNDINNGGVVFLTEQADAEADVAGKGQLWVDTAVPNALGFTNDAGNDIMLTTGAGKTAPLAHHDLHDPNDGSDALDCAAPAELASVQATGEGSAHEFARADHAHQIQHSIADNHIVTIDGTPVDTEVTVWTASGLDSKSEAEFKTLVNLEIGTDVLAEQTIGIADDNLLEVDQVDAADDEYARFTANGIESRSVAEVLNDIGVTSGADVTGDNAPQAHKDSHDPQDGSDALDTANAAEVSVVVAAGTGSSHSLARADHVHAVNHAITDNHILTVDGTIADDDFLKATASGVEGRTYAETRSDLSLQMSYGITIEDPTSSEDITIAFTNRAITVTEMRAVLIGTANGQTVTWTIRHHATDRTNAGIEVVTGGTATTSLTAGSDVTAFDDATIPADSFIWLETTAKGGTVTELHITIVYTVD